MWAVFPIDCTAWFFEVVEVFPFDEFHPWG